MKNFSKISRKPLTAVKWLLFGMLAGAIFFAITGCDNTTGGGGGGESSLTNGDGTLTGAAFESHNTDYSILVRNNTSERLVAFKGDLRTDKLIGGIPAHVQGQGHGLPKDPALFDKTEGFPMILLTESQYNANKSNLQSQKNTPFTRVYVFYNKNGENLTVYELSDKLGGENTLTLINAAQNINIDIRKDGVAGETLGYLPAGLLTTSLYLGNGDYEIFPVFIRYNQTRDILETIYPKKTNGDPWGYSIGFDGAQNKSATLNLKNMIQGLTLTSGAAQVMVDNQTISGGISFYEGTFRHTTVTGIYNIMPNSPYRFQIDMPSTGNTYADSRTVSNWKFGPTGYEVALQVSESNTALKGAFSVERDKLYTVTVVGDGNTPGSIHAWIDAGTPIDTSGFTW